MEKFQYKKFIEILPIEFYGSTIGIREKEDYFAIPANVAAEMNLDVTIVSTKGIKFITKQAKTATLPSVKIIHINDWLSYILFLFKNRDAIIYANGRILQALITCFFGRYNIYIAHFSELPTKWWKRSIFSFFIKRFDAVRVLNTFEREELIKIGVVKEKIYYIPNSIDHEFFGKSVSNEIKEKTKKKYGISEEEKVLLFLANLRKFKRVDTVIRALKVLIEKDIKIKLIIVGEDMLSLEKEKTVKELSNELGVSQNVVITGWLTSEEIKNIMNISDICVNSSIGEGLPLAVCEAASAGIPLCLSNIGSFTSFFTESALFHNPEGDKKLAENILHYFEYPAIAKKHIEINKTIVKERCDYDELKKQLKELFLPPTSRGVSNEK